MTFDFDCLLFLRRVKRIFAKTILWSDDIPSQEEYASQLKMLFTPFLFTII